MTFNNSTVALCAAVLITSWALYVVTRDVKDAVERMGR